ncbi:MAG: hypothetical protein JST89_22425 [Cyanobacteria bacterium SZAS-4]|nr:hypothetical protein [Cyanobacteria bacterium SZAS-4]
MSLLENFKVNESPQMGKVSSAIAQSAAVAYSEVMLKEPQPQRENHGNTLDFSTADIYSKKSEKNLPVELVSMSEPPEVKEPIDASKNAKVVFDKLLDSKREVSMPNGLKLAKTSESTYEIELQGQKLQIDTERNTVITLIPNRGSTGYSLTADKNGNPVVRSDSKNYGGELTITKDGSVMRKSIDKEFPDDVDVTEYPAHGAWIKKTSADADQKEKFERYTKLDPKKPFKDEYGSEIEFKDNGTQQGKIIIKTADGKSISLDDGTVTVTEKNGTTKEYDHRDGEKVSRQMGTRSDYFKEFPGGIVANIGYGGGALEIKNADGSTTRATFGKGSSFVTITKQKS